MSINEVLRVVEKKFSIESPESATLTFGSLFDNVQDYQKNAIQNALEAKELANITSSRVENTNTTINNINTTVSNQQIQINSNTTSIGSQGTNIINLQNNVLTLDKAIIDNSNRIATLENDTSNLNASFNRMAKRMMMEVF